MYQHRKFFNCIFLKKQLNNPRINHKIPSNVIPHQRKHTQSLHQPIFPKQEEKMTENKTSPNKKLEKIDNSNESQPLATFDEYLINDINPEDHLKLGAQNGFSKFNTKTGEIIWRECEILAFDSQTKKYLIRFFNSDIRKEVIIYLFYKIESYFYLIYI